MSFDLGKGPDYDVVVNSLLEKTLAGKLVWHGTADENTFIAAVKGQRTFEMTLKPSRPLLPVCDSSSASKTPSQLATVSWALERLVRPVLLVRDGEGKLLFETPPSAATEELFAVARRIAMHIDEKIDTTVQLLEKI